MLRRKRRVVADTPEQLNRARRFEPVAILDGNVAMETLFVILYMKTAHSDRLDIRVHDGGPTNYAQNDICGGIVAERDGNAQEFAQGNVDLRRRIFVLQRTISVGNAIAGQESNGLIQRKLTLFDEMKSNECEWKFEHGLHRRMRMRIEIAIETGTWQRAGDGNLAMSRSGNDANLMLESCLGKD